MTTNTPITSRIMDAERGIISSRIDWWTAARGTPQEGTVVRPTSEVFREGIWVAKVHPDGRMDLEINGSVVRIGGIYKENIAPLFRLLAKVCNTSVKEALAKQRTEIT